VSFVIAVDVSRVCGWLIPTPATTEIDDAARQSIHRRYAQTIAATLAHERIDLVHMHGVDFSDYIPDSEIPVLITQHLPLDYYRVSPFHTGRINIIFNAVSEWQRQQCLAHASVELVANVIDTQAFFPTAPKQQFVLALGRICPEKGFHLALAAAGIAGVDCVLAGKVYGYSTHQRYFEREIKPLLDGHRRFVGPVGGSLKRQLLSAAQCVLIPSLVAETSSLVAMEALACGTPVVAFRSGALSQIVSDGVTGFMVETVEEMAEAIGRVRTIDSRACRAEACRRFSASRMVANYLDLYQSIIRANLPS
jgi:glycosyltransferase involved in cell wall biosynthesis